MVEKEADARYILNLDLNFELFQWHILGIRFEVARKISNKTKYILNENLRLMKEDETYKHWISQPKSKARTEALTIIRESYDLSKTGAERVVKDIAKSYVRQSKFSNRKKKKKTIITSEGKEKKVRQKRKRIETNQPHIDSATAQAIAADVWKSFEDVMFGKGKEIHFKNFGQLNSVESKSNNAGIRFTGETVEWNGLSMKVSIDKNDDYVKEALKDEIAFCRIIRKPIRGKYKYFLQLILKDIPPQKHKIGKGKVGLDNGISTVAAVSSKEVKLLEFCEGIEELEEEKRIILRKMDRSRRATNPNKYNHDKTFKKVNKQKWVRSNRYMNLLFDLKEIERKIAAKREISHNKTANAVLEMGDEAYVEDMTYKGMQKTWYGRQIKKRAPSKFLAILNRKLGYHGKTLIKINTWKVKASQYDPFSDTFTKKKLSERFHLTEDGYKIQRDCFSAFLIQHVLDTLDGIDRFECIRNFETFYFHYKKLENELIASKKVLPSSIGF